MTTPFTNPKANWEQRFATEEFISESIIKEFASNMEKAGKKLTYKIFPAVHGFSQEFHLVLNRQFYRLA